MNTKEKKEEIHKLKYIVFEIYILPVNTNSVVYIKMSLVVR
jgi:hypothetical protein